jgi:nitrate/nitrite transport system ATP-binding protein
MSEPLLKLTGVNKGFSGKAVLKDVNLEINEGEFIAIIGYSGTGKTTLVNMLAGLTKPDSGEATLGNKPITGPGPDRSVVFQNYSLLPWMTVRENISLAVNQVFPQWSKSERLEHVEKHINMVKLTPAAEKLPRELSGGMRQRVSVARALSLNASILLLDEPLSALDALTRATLQDEISDIWQRTRTTVLWVTNDPDEALLLADKVIPLLPTSPATLGTPIPVPIDRPRDRRTITSDPVFKRLRFDLVQTLLTTKNSQTATLNAGPARPDILPEDLTRVNTLQFFNRRGPRRRSDVATHTNSVDLSQ